MLSKSLHSACSKVPSIFRHLILLIAIITVGLSLRNALYAKMHSWKVTFREEYGTSSMNLLRLQEIPMLNARTGNMEKMSLDSPYSLLLFSSGVECVGCLGNRDVYDQIASLYEPSGLKTYLIAVRTSREEGKAVWREWKPLFPMYVDVNNEIENKIGIPSATPVQILVDRHGNIIDALVGSDPAMKYEERFSNAFAQAKCNGIMKYLWR
jgi:hypothetical protein